MQDNVFIFRRPKNILEKLGQYQGCWWPGSLHHQVINIHDSNQLCRRYGFLHSTRKDFNYLCHFSVKKMLICFHVS